jgi:predicted PurR-regulated permease PerM
MSPDTTYRVPSDERRVERTVAGLGLGLVAVGCLVTLWPFATPLIWAAIIAFSTWPLFARLERMLGGRAGLAAVLVTLATGVVLVAPLVLLVMTLADNVASLIALFRHWLEVGPPGPPDWVLDLPLMGPRLYERWRQIAVDGASFTAALTPHLGTVREALLSAGAALGGGIVSLLLSLVIAGFLSAHGTVLAGRFDTALVRIGGSRGRQLGDIVRGTVRGVVYGVLGANLIQSVLAVVGFALAGVPGAVLLGVLSFFLTLIPLATGLLWIPAVTWLVVQGQIGWAIFLAVWSLLNYGLLENVLRALLIGRSSELPLLLLLLGILGGIVMFGLLGLLIGPTVLALGYALVSEWSAARAGAPEQPETGASDARTFDLATR